MAPHFPDRSLKGPTFTTRSLRQEYKYLETMREVEMISDVFTFDQIITSITLDIIRIVLAVLDILLLLYRVSRTVMAARTLCRGFEETHVVAQRLPRKQSKTIKQDGRKVNSHSMLLDGDAQPIHADKDIASEYEMHIDSPLPKGHKYSPRELPTHVVQNNVNSLKVPPKPKLVAAHLQHPQPTYGRCYRLQFLRAILLKAAESSTIPKLVIGLMLLVLFGYATHVITILLSEDIMSDIDGFQMFVYGLEVKVNRTNWYLSEQAKHFNHITMEIYKGQMISELSNFQGLVQYFNSGG